MANNATKTSTATGYKFGPWRDRIWPVHGTELKVFLPLLFIKFFTSFNYTVLNSIKDTVVVTSKAGGAEVIPVLKGGVVITVAFLAMLGYSKLSNKLTRENTFYAILAPFLVFFFIYGYFLFPNQEVLVPEVASSWLLATLGPGHSHWVAVFSNWMHSMFFVATELWGGMMIGVLFWGFANHVTSVKDAARFYALYTAGGHIGTILGGSLVLHYSQAGGFDANYAYIIKVLMTYVVLIGLVVAFVFWWVNKYTVNQPNFVIDGNKSNNKKSKTKLSLTDSLFMIAKSPYIGFIALMIIGYGLSVNLVEVSFKAILKLNFPDSRDYQTYMGMLQVVLGFTSLFVSVFFCTNFIRKVGWHKSAQATPVVIGCISMVFFALYFVFSDYNDSDRVFFSFTYKDSLIMVTPLLILVLVGTLHNIICKVMKYCFFDPTKEMAYIPLDEESKVKGKAAVDLVGARFGKSGSSWLQLALIDLVGTGSILGVVPLLIPCVVLSVVFSCYAVYSLSKRFKAMQEKSNAKLVQEKAQADIILEPGLQAAT